MQLHYQHPLTAAPFASWPTNEEATKTAAPLQSWTVSRVNFRHNSYYLYVEAETGFAVVADNPSFERFCQILHFQSRNTVASARLVHSYLNQLKQNVQVQPQQTPTLTVKRWEGLLKEWSPQIQKQIRLARAQMDPRVRSLYFLGGILYHADGYRTLDAFCQRLQQVYGTKPQHPDATADYVDWQPNFESYDQWSQYEWRPITEVPHQVTKAVRQNNQRLLADFKRYREKRQVWALDGVVEQFLARLLQQYLLFPTSFLENFAYLVGFMENGAVLQTAAASYEALLEFLAHAGMISRGDVEIAKQDLHQVYEFRDPNVVNAGLLPTGTYPAADGLDDPRLLELNMRFRQDLDGKRGDDQAAAVESDKLTGTLVFDAYLEGMKKQVWRRFAMAKSIDLLEFAMAVIVMFHGNTTQPFGIRGYGNTGDDDRGKSLEKQFVADLHPGLDYVIEYGDGAEFKLHLLAAFDRTANPAIQVQFGAGRGFVTGIVDTATLQQYYQDYEAGQLGAYDWLEEQPDPTKCDFASLNRRAHVLHALLSEDQK